ncbi:MAG TPA: rhomboid family intramembrane serine protease [Sandaracinaceae bacterium LLY-WYZ-13_1]|nr:rhomboid family intramembrane serine protease [Sandaracinaceae bacterium LLY-WYZ-13_1]
MIPLRDINPTRTRPVVTYVLIGINVVVWLYQWSLGAGPEGQLFVQRWGVVPYYLTQEASVGSWITPLTSMFMHGGWMHLIGNVWFLHVFGDNIEDELGRVRYALFYVLSGLAAVAAQVAIDPASRVPMVGASGAIAGVLGGYVMLHPKAPVVTLVPIVFFIQLVELPAWIFLFVWFGLQLLHGFTSLGLDGAAGGIAFFAHIGGFVAGLVLVRLFRGPPDDRGPVTPELRRAPRTRI